MDKMNAMRRFVDSEKPRQQMNKPFTVVGQPYGTGKRLAQLKLQNVKEAMKNGGYENMASDKGFLEMTDELLMDSGETVSKLIGKEMDEMILAAVERGDMHIDLCKTADAIHQNAVNHGWWEEERDVDEVKALIHSEWSEALEEARAGRPLEWFMCKMQIPTNCCCEESFRCAWKEKMGDQGCPVRGEKPEGIAVELIDGVIRILDWMASQYNDPDCVEWSDFRECMNTAPSEVYMVYAKNVKDMKASKLVNVLHDFTSQAVDGVEAENYGIAVGAVFEWIRAQGMEPEAILMRKHRYNTTRPYKHGKKF